MQNAESVTLRPAAQYLRMSTESQNYSLGHQVAAIAAYAIARGFRIVATYSDAGISGLTLRRRAGLQNLLADVVSGQAAFSTILTYDVSRWGRFQDIDESAHYEFLCRQAGVRVEYCSEAFDNDGTPIASLLKHLKRMVAASSMPAHLASRRSCSSGRGTPSRGGGSASGLDRPKRSKSFAGSSTCSRAPRRRRTPSRAR